MAWLIEDRLAQHARVETLDKLMDDAINLWVDIGHGMLLAAAQELREKRAARAAARRGLPIAHRGNRQGLLFPKYRRGDGRIM